MSIKKYLIFEIIILIVFFLPNKLFPSNPVIDLIKLVILLISISIFYVTNWYFLIKNKIYIFDNRQLIIFKILQIVLSLYLLFFSILHFYLPEPYYLPEPHSGAECDTFNKRSMLLNKLGFNSAFVSCGVAPIPK
jgi:hypothetical protein